MKQTSIPTKKLLLSTFISVSLCFALVASVNADAATWAQTYSKEDSVDVAYSAVATSDGGYAMVGYTGPYPAGGNYDFWLVKTDAFGDMQWSQTYGGEDGDSPDSLVAMSDGGYAILGTTDSFGAGKTDLWLIKTDANGDVEWNQTYGGSDVEIADSFIATSDGGYAIIGGLKGNASGYDIWLIKTDELGNVEWNQTYGGADYDYAGALVATSDGGYALAGSTESFGAGDRDFWLIKTDELGNVEWNQTYGGPNSESAKSLIETSDGGYILGGTEKMVDDLMLDTGDFWIVKTDASGVVEWNQTYGGELADRFASLVETSDGGYALAGGTNGSSIESGNLWLIKTDADGNVEWDQTYGGADYDVAFCLITASDGGYVVAGGTESFGVGGGDFWLIKTDENGVAPVVPEAPWVVLPLLATATAAILISKKKLLNKPFMRKPNL